MPSDQGVLADSVSAPPCWITNPPRYVMHLSLMHTYAKSRPWRCPRARPRPGGRRVDPASERTNGRPDARQHCNTLETPPSRRSHRTGRTHEERRRHHRHRTGIAQCIERALPRIRRAECLRRRQMYTYSIAQGTQRYPRRRVARAQHRCAYPTDQDEAGAENPAHDSISTRRPERSGCG